MLFLHSENLIDRRFHFRRKKCVINGKNSDKDGGVKQDSSCWMWGRGPINCNYQIPVPPTVKFPPHALT